MVTNKTTVILNCFTLVTREITLYKDSENKEYSSDLIKTIIKVFEKESKPLLGGETDLVDNMLDLLSRVVDDTDNFDVETIIDNLNIVLKDHQVILNTAIKNISKEMSLAGLKSSIVSMRNQLNKYYREVQIRKKISKASYDLLTDKFEGTFKEYIDTFLRDIDTLNSKVSDKTPGLVAEIDIDDESMDSVLSTVKDLVSGMGKLKTGWKDINVMLQGGFTRGNMVMINALPHHYKSGIARSFFMQIARHNIPMMLDKDKKPLVVYISFEDDADVFINEMYKYLYFEEFAKVPDMDTVTVTEMKQYMTARLRVNGYHVKMLRVNPAEWTYKDLFNYILKLEALGYEIHGLVLDYLAKLPATGCIGKGGVEYRDLFDRVRQFCSPKKITVITPHQVSTEAKQLIRNGETHLNLPKLIAEKGYTEISKQLDQVVDVELCIAKAMMNRKPVLAIQRGKHRGAGIIDEKDKYKILKFPYKAPIPPDIDKEDEILADDPMDSLDDLFAA